MKSLDVVVRRVQLPWPIYFTVTTTSYIPAGEGGDIGMYIPE